METFFSAFETVKKNLNFVNEEKEFNLNSYSINSVSRAHFQSDGTQKAL
jgi:hypothetical protein